MAALAPGHHDPRGLRRLNIAMAIFHALQAIAVLALANDFADVDPDEISTWRERLLLQSDPYLSLQTLGLPS